MSTNLNELFAAEASNTSSASTRGLAGTAQLTHIASEITTFVMAKVNSNYEELKDIFLESRSNANTMDKLLKEQYNLEVVDVSFIKALDENVVAGMLKSQQSKRSRAKSKTMTLDNYKSMMTAAVAELLIRQAMGKNKHEGGIRREHGSVVFNEEALEKLAADQETLRKELRNIQSKKSIAKSKADFDETSTHWLELLQAEEQLKSIRVAGVGARASDVTKTKLSELLGDVELDNLKATDSKALLARLKELL